MFGKKKQPYIKNAPKDIAFKPEITDKKPTAPKKKKAKKAAAPKIGLAQIFAAIFDGSFLTKNWLIRIIPFLLYLVLLVIIYIGNQYSSLRRVKEIEIISNELKELRNEHISTKSDLMYQKRRSELARKLQTEGIKESNVPPTKIYVKPESEK